MADLFIFPQESLKPINYPKITNNEIIFILTISVPIGQHPGDDAPTDDKLRFLETYMPLEFQKLQYMKTIDKALDILRYSLYSRESNVLVEIADKINDMYNVKKLTENIIDAECTKDIASIQVTLTEAKRRIYPDISLSKYASANAKQLNIRKSEYYSRLFQCYIEQDSELNMLTLYRVSNIVFNFIRLNNLSHLIKNMKFKNEKIERLAEKVKQRVNVTLEAMAEKRIVQTDENLLNSITVRIKEIDLGQ